MGDKPGQDKFESMLGLEDLDKDQQEQVEAWLKDHPAAVEHLGRLRATEAAAKDPVPIQKDALFQDFALDDAEIAAEQASLADLRQRLGLPQPGRRSRGGGSGNPVTFFRERPVKWAPWLGALAAILALAIILPLTRDNDHLISELYVVGIEPTGDAVRSPGSTTLPAGTLATGQAFTLDFHLEKDAHVVIYHVDPQGVVGRIFPGPGESTDVRLAGGLNHRFPTVESGEDWILGVGTGMESFLVAANSGSDLDYSGLDAEMAQAGLRDVSRDEALVAMSELLAEWGAEVDLVEIRHID